MLIIKIFITGFVILVVAIIANYIAVKLGLTTWYSFLESVGKNSLSKTIKDTSILSMLFLFIIYPLLLGFSGYLVIRFFK